MISNIYFSSIGQKGEPGLPGFPGPPGLAGARGNTGQKGNQGEDGGDYLTGIIMARHSQTAEVPECPVSVNLISINFYSNPLVTIFRILCTSCGTDTHCCTSKVTKSHMVKTLASLGLALDDSQRCHSYSVTSVSCWMSCS